METIFELTVIKESQKVVKYFDTQDEAEKEILFYKEIYKPEIKIDFVVKKTKKSIDSY